MFITQMMYCQFKTEEEAKHHWENVLSVNIKEDDRGYEETEDGWQTWWKKSVWVDRKGNDND